MAEKLVLRLFVNGMTKSARIALNNLRQVCAEFENTHEYEIEVIDINEHPQLAEDEKILATPTLVKKLPPPIRKIIGDLSEREQLLLGLDIVEA